MKRVLTIQDISCVGKCSLTVALPIISAMGVETAVLPTAVLSTHTQFSGFTFRDLTDDMIPIADHWQKENLTFDAVYTGYLGSERQIDIVADIFDRFGGGETKIVVDPAMADNGVLYKGFKPEFPAAMFKLCGKADIILPNLTEAAFMLGVPYPGENYDEAYIRKMLVDLTSSGARVSVLTGVSFEKGKLGVMAYDSVTGEYFSYFADRLPAAFHGTGDIFASAFTGALSGGMSVEDSLKVAVDYTVECIRVTLESGSECWYGVEFEKCIPFLVKRISG